LAALWPRARRRTELRADLDTTPDSVQLKNFNGAVKSFGKGVSSTELLRSADELRR